MARFGKVEPAQAVFRCLLEAMSHPGRRFRIPCEGGAARQAVVMPMLQVAETLLDHEVGFHVVAPGGDDRFSDIIFSCTKAARAALDRADFIFVEGGSSRGAVEHVRRGSQRYPDQGATVIYCLGSPQQTACPSAEPEAILRGPGIDGSIRPQVPGLAKDELERLRRINAGFPLGVDVLVLGAPDHLMAIARSTRISLE
jgi:alpha-D-ribose 1-methylphosphonate 5-triphosphate synthase subunit PhnH